MTYNESEAYGMALIKCPECGREFSDQARSCPSCAYPVPRRTKFLPVIQNHWSVYYCNLVQASALSAAQFFMSTVIPQCNLQIPPSLKNESSVWNSLFRQTQNEMRQISTPESMASYIELMENAVQEACAGLPRCPQCGPYMVKKISGVDRAFGVGLFGAASRSFGKTMECRDCDYRW